MKFYIHCVCQGRCTNTTKKFLLNYIILHHCKGNDALSPNAVNPEWSTAALSLTFNVEKNSSSHFIQTNQLMRLREKH